MQQQTETAEIPLTKGKVALVDATDLPLLSGNKWCAIVIDGNTYAYSARSYMHRLIMGAEDGQKVDHRNGDGLDNRRGNLRLATKAQNSMNSRPQQGRRYKGVSWHKKGQKWRASIMLDGKAIHLGLFVSEEEAARAYDSMAAEMFGDFARLNFPETAQQLGVENDHSAAAAART